MFSPWFYYSIVGSWFEGSFTVDVSKPKPNRPNTMNLVKKWAKEQGLSEDFFKGLAGSLGSGIIKGVEERWKSILGLSPRMNSSSSQFSDASRPEPLGVLRTVIASLCYYISFCLIHLDRPSVDHVGHSLSTCPIQRFPQLAVSCYRQGDTVQGSFLH